MILEKRNKLKMNVGIIKAACYRLAKHKLSDQSIDEDCSIFHILLIQYIIN